jgi:hypothetical protein
MPCAALAWADLDAGDTRRALLTFASAALSFLYAFLFVMPTGCLCCCLPCRVDSGEFMGDLVLESLQTPSTKAGVAEYLASLQTAPPALTLCVDCWHTRRR